MEVPSRVGRYELLERVGQGSLGALYRGLDTVLDREVAVKVMPVDFSSDAEARARFFHEAKAAARLQHHNIVTVFEFGEHEGTPFVVTEFLRGESLADRLHRDPPLASREALDVAVQLCAGLEFAHAQGVIHRDVKPANIWLCRDNSVKLLDFGIATAGSSSATLSDEIGGHVYMSPEQIQGHDVDSRTDIFSTGIVLFEMLSGALPFDAESPAGAVLKIVADPPALLNSAAGAELSPALVAAVLRSLEKSPSARYQRASELGRELKSVQSALLGPREAATLTGREAPVRATREAPVRAAPEPQVPPVRLPPPRVPGQVRQPFPHRRLLTLAALVLIVAAAIAAWQSRTEPEPDPGRAPIPPAPSTAPPATTSTVPAAAPPATANGRGSDVPPAATVTLQVTSRPAAARILVDGEDTGKVTPADVVISPAAPPSSLQLQLPGYQNATVAVTADVIGSGTVDVAMVRVVEPVLTLVVSGDYPFAVMDGQRTLSPAATSHTVKVAGLRAVQLRADQFFLNEPLRLDRGRGATLRASAPRLGSITVSAVGAMRSCRVYVNDRLLDTALPVERRQIASGVHRVKLHCAAGESNAQRLYVLPGQHAPTTFPADTLLHRPKGM